MKEIIAIVIALFLTFGMQAQTLNAKAGITISTITTDSMGTLGRNDYLFSPNIFLGIEYLEHNLFYLSTNLGYIRKGASVENFHLDNTGASTFITREQTVFDYVSFNTCFNAKFPVTEAFQPFLTAGPRIDVLVNMSDKADLMKDTDKLNHTSVGLLLGGGIRCQIGKMQLGCEVNYLMNFNKIVQLRELGNQSVWDRTVPIYLAVGYRF